MLAEFGHLLVLDLAHGPYEVVYPAVTEPVRHQILPLVPNATYILVLIDYQMPVGHALVQGRGICKVGHNLSELLSHYVLEEVVDSFIKYPGLQNIPELIISERIVLSRKKTAIVESDIVDEYV